MFGLTSAELKLLTKPRTPAAIQDFLEKIPINFEKKGETVLSPRRVIKEWRCHCAEGAFLAALMLRLQGYKPLVVDLKSVWHDDDHVIAVWRQHGYWGAISKTNHAVLRYREPIYRDIRELVLSYFHEYFTNNGVKTLRSYSKPVNLARFDKRSWVISEQDLWYIVRYLDKVPHYPVINRSQISNLRLADKIERQAGKLTAW